MNLITKDQYLSLMDLPEEHRKILRLIGKGKESSITSKQIQLITGFTDEKIRIWIAEMVNLYRVPIGGCSKGFFIMVTDEEYESVYRNLKSRAFQNWKRAKAVKDNPHRDQLMAMLDEVIKEEK
jgi:hypothetical protein